ncbi:MAG TPA: hypothetical protein VLH77_05140, partial [Gammaproteobacteria bacterium]|nr:hypothetical protein [Gammaproteobacteria bacterium]
MTFKTVLKYTVRLPFTLPWLAWRWGSRKVMIDSINKSFDSRSCLNRHGLRLLLGISGWGVGVVYGVVGGCVLGGLIGSLIFPGVATIIGSIIGALWGAYTGGGFGLAAGALLSKLTIKLWHGGKYFYNKKKQDNNNPADNRELLPVRYSKHDKYSVKPSYQLNAEGCYEKGERRYSKKDVWKIFHILYREKQENKKQFGNIMARAFPEYEDEADHKRVKRNQDYNQALDKVRDLDFEFKVDQVEQVEQDEEKEDAIGPMDKPASAPDVRKRYKL